MHLGTVLSHFGERAQAEVELKQGCQSDKLDGRSELVVQLYNALAELYFQSGRWQDAVTVCQKIFATWDHSGYNAELLKTLFFITNAHYWLEDFDNGKKLANYWINLLTDSNPQSKCLAALIQAETRWKESVINDTVIQLFEKGLDLSKQYCPNAYQTAYCRRRFGYVLKARNKSIEAEIQDKIAMEIYSVHYPKSIDYAICLRCLARLHASIGENDLAIKGYNEAYELFKTQFPKSGNFACCLYNMGLLYESEGKKVLAIKLIKEALELFAELNNFGFISRCKEMIAKLTT